MASTNRKEKRANITPDSVTLKALTLRHDISAGITRQAVRFQPIFLVLIRFIIYGLLGVCAEVVVSAILHKYEGKEQNWSTRAPILPVEHPLYGLIAPVFEPLHDAISGWSCLIRGAIYVSCFLVCRIQPVGVAAYAHGACPWSYAHCPVQPARIDPVGFLSAMVFGSGCC